MAYRPTSKTEANKAHKQDLILRAARQLILDNGFSALSVSAVAKIAGIATGSVYRYFPNKIDLCIELFRQLSGNEVDEMRLIAQGKLAASQRMALCCHSFIRRAFRAPVQSYALMAEPLDPALEAERLLYRRSYAQVYQGIIEDGIKSGEFCDQDAVTSSLSIVGMLAEPLLEPLNLARGQNHTTDNDGVLSLQITNLCLRSLGAPDAKSETLQQLPTFRQRNKTL